MANLFPISLPLIWCLQGKKSESFQLLQGTEGERIQPKKQALGPHLPPALGLGAQQEILLSFPHTSLRVVHSPSDFLFPQRSGSTLDKQKPGSNCFYSVFGSHASKFSSSMLTYPPLSLFSALTPPMCPMYPGWERVSKEVPGMTCFLREGGLAVQPLAAGPALQSPSTRLFSAFSTNAMH